MPKTANIHVIAAIAKNGVIGKNKQLPWHLPDDLRHFKALTIGQCVIMGRKTYESIGKPLPNRQNIVISSQTNYPVEAVSLAQNLAQALTLADPSKSVFIIGGASIYQQAMPIADTFYLTEVLAEVEGTIYFPQWRRDEWQVVETTEHLADEKHAYPFRLSTLKRKNSY